MRIILFNSVKYSLLYVLFCLCALVSLCAATARADDAKAQLGITEQPILPPATNLDWVKKENWKWSADFLIGKQLTGSRLGILGMGRIGRALAKIAKSFGMEIHYRNRTKLSSDKEMGATFHDNIKSLFSVSDVLSICCPATKETKDIINKDTLEYFPTGAIITKAIIATNIDQMFQLYNFILLYVTNQLYQ